MTNTETTTWYHGTRRGFTTGGYLVPRDAHQGAGTTAPMSPGAKAPADQGAWVYITRDLEIAWVYANHASGRGAPKVLVVEPIGTVVEDYEHGPNTDAWKCEMAKAVKVLKRDAVEASLRDRLGDDFDPKAYTSWPVMPDPGTDSFRAWLATAD